MKTRAIVAGAVLVLLLAGQDDAAALATAGVFSQPGGINDSDTGTHAASASGASSNGDIEVGGQASADLTAGVLRVLIEASPNATLIGDDASASATFSDTISIVGPGSGAVPVTFLFDVDAHLTGDAPADGTYRLNFAAEFSLTGPAVPPGVGIGVQRFKNPIEDTISCSGVGCNLLNTPLTTAGVVDATLVYEAFLAPGVSYGVAAALSAVIVGTPASFVRVDASNTGRLTAILPPGYAFSSDSGGFLTAVPLPAGLWLFASALGCLGAWRRRCA